jgi:hypothetical protein
MSGCARCGSEADFYADGLAFCGPTCMELLRRGVVYSPEQAPLQLPAGDARTDAVDELLDARRDAELDRLERLAQAEASRRLDRFERSRYQLAEADLYGAVQTSDNERLTP